MSGDQTAQSRWSTITLSGSLPAGEYQPEITATVDGRSDSVSPYILVRNKRTYLEQALNELVELYSSLAVAAARVEETTGNGNGAVVPPGIDNKSRQIASRTIDIIDRIEGAKDTGPGQSGGMPSSNAINNQIRSVINQVSALQNQIASQAGTGLDADPGPQLRRDTDALINI